MIGTPATCRCQYLISSYAMARRWHVIFHDWNCELIELSPPKIGDPDLLGQISLYAVKLFSVKRATTVLEGKSHTHCVLHYKGLLHRGGNW